MKELKLLRYLAFVAMLLAGCELNRNEQALLDNIKAGDEMAVAAYIREGGDVNFCDEPGNTPLHWAVNEDLKGSHRSIVNRLITAGANVNARCDIQTTPLHLASNRGTAELLIEAGADPNASDSDGQTLLFSAAHGVANAPPATHAMYLDLLRLLIEHKVELNTRDKRGETVLHRIAGSYDQGNAGVVIELLLEHGAKLNIGNRAGETPLDVAISNDRQETVKLIRDRGGKTALQLPPNVP